MSQFLSSLNDRLTTMEQEVQNLPGELDSIVARLDRGKLRRLFSRLDQDFNKLLDRLFDAHHRSGVLALPVILQPTYPYIREITSEDLCRWRAAYKSDVQVIIGKGRVEVIAASELAKEYQTTVSQVILDTQRQGYAVLGWDEYQNLLDEIGSLIGENEESLSGTIVGVPVTTTHSPQEVKILTKSSP